MHHATAPPGPLPTGGWHLHLPAHEASAGQARQALSQWLEARSTPQRLIDDAELVLTELVTNAVLHATPPASAGPQHATEGRHAESWPVTEGRHVEGRHTGIRCTAALTPQHALHIEVHDHGTPPARLPLAQHGCAHDEKGRGLLIVEALATYWETRISDITGGTVVHALLTPSATA